MTETSAVKGRLWQILPGLLLAAVGIWLMTGLFAPLTLGLLIAGLLAPAAEAITRHTGCPRQLAALGTMTLFYLLLGTVLARSAGWVTAQGAALLRILPGLWTSSLLPGLETVLPRLEEFFSRHAPVILSVTDRLFTAAEQTLPGLISNISARAAGSAARFMTRLPSLLLGSVFTVILSFCFAADFPTLRSLLQKYLPPGAAGLLRELRGFGSRVLIRMLRAWVLLSLATLAALCLGLWLLGISSPLTAAGLITLLDLLPLIGSGMILLPWGLWELLQGRTALGAGLWLLFGCTEVLRAILEPRLLGAGGGAPPLLLTAALFAGLRLGGALGAMLFPAAVLFLWDLNRQGKLPGLTAG